MSFLLKSFALAIIATALTYPAVVAQEPAKKDSLKKKQRSILDSVRTLGEVVVVGAGAFEASDKAKGASLTPIDAVTVAGNGGDIANALRWLPGAQQIGEKEGLFVRGGSGEESKQFVDGILLRNPNFTSVPGMPQGARLNPFLFKGILFSSGGYSAQYGQALSSALILESVDLPDESSASLHIFPQSMGTGFQKVAKNKTSSYGASIRYGNLKPYNSVVPQQQDYFNGPLNYAGDANFRIKTSKTGMLKFYTNYGYNHTGLRTPDVDSSSLFSSFEVKGSNFYNNLSYRESLGNFWKFDAAVGYSRYKEELSTGLQNGSKEKITLAHYPFKDKSRALKTESNTTQGRAVLTKVIGNGQAIRFGSEVFYSDDHLQANDTLRDMSDHLSAVFAEGDIRISRRIAARAGLRLEHSSIIGETSLAPRLSLAYRMNNGGQFNVAYGVFYQKPENIYLFRGEGLGLTRATHYILNYNRKLGNRLLRLEAFYKNYDELITTEPTITNGGSGYAKGVELFWRDKKTFKNFDYWVSYTYLDTKRKHLNFPEALQPQFATPHTLAFALKRYFEAINFNANLSYSLATGRPYYDIAKADNGYPQIRHQGTTNMYNAVNLSFAYMFTMFPNWKHRDFSGIGMGINNVFGTKQVFGYNYSHNGLNRAPVMLPAARSYYLGIFMTFGIDRREDFIEENL